MKHLVQFIFTTAILSTLSSYAAKNEPKKSVIAKNKVELMYYQHAKQGRISVSETKKGCYHLVLAGLSPAVIYFSNYPLHISGHMTLSKYASSWQHAENSQGIQPNAVLHAYNSKTYSEQSAISLPITLSNLKYSETDKTISYTACSINRDEERMPLATPTLASAIYEVDLFIDPFEPWPP